MDKHIYHAPKALNLNQCSELINLFNNSNKSEVKFGPLNEYTKSTNTYFYEYVLLNPLEILVFESLSTHAQEFVKIHPFLVSKSISPWGIQGYCMLKKYKAGDFYSVEHCEHNAEMGQELRILAWMFYLNDINSGGGGTSFPRLNINLNAKAGDLYIWPAAWTHSHIGIPAPFEEKYILSGWFCYHKK